MSVRLGKYTIETTDALVFLLFCIAMYFPIFHHLAKLPIAIWDESLFSLRALHLHQTGEYLSNFNLYDGLPSHRNTKLPFTTFFQVLSMKLIGVNEYAIRLPISFIFLGTALYMIHHFRYRFEEKWAGYVFGLVAITAIGFVKPHMLRTGDQDAPFACYMVLATIQFVRYLDTRSTWSLVGFVCWSLAAVLTKNLLAGLLAPGILIYALGSKQLLGLLKDYKFLLASLSIIVVYVGVVYYYEVQFPGFFDRMWNYELAGRYTTAFEHHDKSPGFYLHYLSIQEFVPYLLITPIIFGLSFREGVEPKLKSSIQCTMAVLVCYLAIVSFSQTQTTWYVAPIYLLGAYIMALGFVLLRKSLLDKSKKTILSTYLPIGLVWLILYCAVLNNIFSPSPISKDDKYGLFMAKLAKENPDIKTYTLVDNNFGTTATFYKEMYNLKDEGYSIGYQRTIDYDTDQVIMTCLNNVLNPTAEQYEFEVLRHWDDCKLLKILSKH